MKISSEDLVKEFYESLENTPYSFEQIKEVCYGPWTLLHKIITGDSLQGMRMKYFGKFAVRPNRAKHILKRTKEYLKEGKLTEGTAKKQISNIERFLKNED